MGIATRQQEVDQVVTTLASGQGLLVLGEPGAGKSALAAEVGSRLVEQGYTVATATYNGAAKETLMAIADQVGVDVMTEGDRPKQKTAQQLREDLAERLQRGKMLLVADDANRWSASLRYWLEELQRSGVLLLLLAFEPPRKDIFLKLPKLDLQPLREEEIRDLMQQEAQAQQVALSPSDLATLQTRAGNNPALARRLVKETALGIAAVETGEHYQYVDGTPFLLALLSVVGVVRFIGLGLGDKALYVLGGIATVLMVGVRALLYAANRRRRSL